MPSPFDKRKDARKIFVGREDELEFFRTSILGADSPEYNLLSVSGEGGVGKSTLLAHFTGAARSIEYREKWVVAQADERNAGPDPVKVMERLAEQLAEAGFDLPGFKVALDAYNDTYSRLRDDWEASRFLSPVVESMVEEADPDHELENTARNMLSQIASQLLATTDQMEIGRLKKQRDHVQTQLAESRQSYAPSIKTPNSYRSGVKESQEQHGPSEADRRESAMKELTAKFVVSLNRLADGTPGRAGRRVLLVFDTFEQLESGLVPWFLDHLMVQPRISGEIVLLVAGRNSLERTGPDHRRWLDYIDDDVLRLISLSPLDEAETRNYLKERGITDEERVRSIWQRSGGLPLFLGMATANPNGLFDPTGDIVDIYLRGVPETERRLALEASLFSHPFNREDLAVFEYIVEDQRDRLYTWLVGQTFIRPNGADGRYRYHDRAKDMFTTHLYQDRRTQCLTRRRALADRYRLRTAEIEANEGEEAYQNPEWAELALAEAYQRLLLPEESHHLRAIERVLKAWHFAKLTDKDLEPFLQPISQAEPSTQANTTGKATAKSLYTYVKDESKTPEYGEAVNYLLEKTAKVDGFDPKLIAGLHRNRGRTYKEVEKYDLALKEFDQAISINPKLASAFADRGDTYRLLKNYEEAIKDFDKAIELNPKDEWCYAGRGKTLFDLKRFDEALKDFSKAIEIDLKHTWAYALRGQTLFEQKKYEEALKDFSKAIEIDPKYQWAYQQRSEVYRETKQYELALQDVDKLIELDSTFWGYHYQRSDVLKKMGKLEVALETLDKALQLEPGKATLFDGRGVIYQEMKEYDKALADFNKAIELDHNYKPSYVNRGSTYRLMKEYEKALQDFSKAIEIDPEYAWAYAQRGRIYSEQKEYGKALQDFDKGIEIDHKYVWVYVARGKVYQQLKEYNRAFRDFDKALAVDPDYEWAFSSRAFTSLWMNNLTQAKQDFARCWELDHNDVNNGWMMEWAGLSLDARRPELEVAERLEIIATVGPEQSMAYVCRGVALWLRKQPDEAVAQFEKSLKVDPDRKGNWDANFWMGLVTADTRIGTDETAIAAVEKALELEMLPVLLRPLEWLRESRPDFYESYVVPLFARFDFTPQTV